MSGLDVIQQERYLTLARHRRNTSLIAQHYYTLANQHLELANYYTESMRAIETGCLIQQMLASADTDKPDTSPIG